MTNKLKKQEEIVNSITHGIGIILAVAALTLLVVFASLKGNAWHIVSFSIFGVSMIILYVASTLYHSEKNVRRKVRLNVFDHSAIYVLIAGTYTPIALVYLQGAIGWVIFGIIWLFAILGVIYKNFFYTHKYRKISAFIYVIMGYTIIMGIVPLIKRTPSITLWFLLIGCLSYTVSVIFYLARKIPFGHGIFHLLILAGSICHFFAFLYSLPL